MKIDVIDMVSISQVDTLSETHRLLQEEHAILQKLSAEQNDTVSRLASELGSSRKEWTSENDRLRQELEERGAELQKFRKAVDDGENDKRMTVRMYNATLKV